MTYAVNIYTYSYACVYIYKKAVVWTCRFGLSITPAAARLWDMTLPSTVLGTILYSLMVRL